MDSFRFETPQALALLAMLPLLVVAAWPRTGASRSLRVGSLAAAAQAAPTWRVRAEPLLLVLRLLAAVALIVALGRPQRGEAVAQTEGEGIDIVLAFDVSSSMTQPFAGTRSRLDVAEDVLANFIEARTDDRVGLVAFQGSTITLSPLTTDYNAVAASAREAGSLDLVDGTAIGSALGASVNVLRGSSAASRIVILLTDGENNAGEVQPLAAARIAERLGVRVYTVGVVGGLFPTTQSRLNVDEALMENIADVTGGTYSRAEDPQALADIYAGIDELETSRFEGRDLLRFDEVAPYFLAAAAVALALEVVLRASLFRRAA